LYIVFEKKNATTQCIECSWGKAFENGPEFAVSYLMEISGNELAEAFTLFPLRLVALAISNSSSISHSDTQAP
jgi:hypothetical protein